MIADLITKTLQGYLFVNCFDAIMGRKHMDTLQMGPPYQECLRNMDEVESRIKAWEKNMGKKKLYADIVFGEKHGEPL